MKRIAAAVAVAGLAAAALTSGTAWAARNGGTSAPPTSQIWVATIDGDAMTAPLTAAPALDLGDRITFGTKIEPLAGHEYPMVAVSCYQDVNGDGRVETSLTGPDIVYSWLDTPSATYPLGGQSSIWTLRGGGDAVCRADLDAYAVKGGKQSIRVLKSLGFDARG